MLVPASMVQLGAAPMHVQCLGADRAQLYHTVKLNKKRLRMSRKDTSMALNAGSWDTTGAQINGQTVAARIRRRVAIFVEPSPFSHVSGMKNRFECLIQGLRGSLPVYAVINCWIVRFSLIPEQSVAELGDDVTVVTPDVNPPKHYFGARVRSSGYRTCLRAKQHDTCAKHLSQLCTAGLECARIQHAILQITYIAVVPWALHSGVLAFDHDTPRRDTCVIPRSHGLCRHPLCKVAGSSSSGIVSYSYTRSGCLRRCCHAYWMVQYLFRATVIVQITFHGTNCGRGWWHQCG